MQLRLILKTVALGLLGYIFIPLAVLVIWTMTANIPGMNSHTIQLVTKIASYTLLFGLFIAVGLRIGRRVTRCWVGNTVAAGFLLLIGVSLIGRLWVLILHAKAIIPTKGYSASFLYTLLNYLGQFGIVIIVTIIGGWIGCRGRDKMSQN